MSDSPSPPPPEQEILLPADPSPSSSPSPSPSSSSDDVVVDADLVIALHHHQTNYGGEDEEGQQQQQQRRRRLPMGGMPPAPAVAFVTHWAVLGVGGGGAAPATAASIEALPTVEVSEPGAVCAICKDELPVAAAARRLPCGHLYHSSCIVPWLQVHNSCPICRCRLTEPAAAGDVASAPPASEQVQDTPPAAATSGLQLPAQAVSVSGEGEETTTVPSA